MLLAAAGFRLLLIVSLWQAPVVWGHQHSTDAADLAEHLALFHGGDFESCNLGWHWHVSLPQGEAPCSPESPQSPRDSLPGVVDSVSTPGSHLLSARVLHELADLIPLAASGGSSLLTAAAGPNYLATWSAAHSPQQLLCRMSC